MIEAPEGAPPLEVGAQLAPGYEILAHLRRGRDLDVYDIWSIERDCRCIAKTLRPDRLRHPPARQRLLSEGRLLLELSHPHIVRAYACMVRPQPLVVLETLPGATLEYLLDEGRLSVEETAVLGLQLCSALHYLHGRGVLHLDLKPSNIISVCGLAKLLDLSIAQPPGPGRAGVGTRVYMAPEQRDGSLLSAATDVWGVGAVLFECLAGVRALDEKLQAEGARWRAVQESAPEPLGRAILACLEPEPEQRPSVAELRSILRGFV
jgi:serine/threonine protein kinase